MNILIVTGAFGMGHRMAAEAVKDELGELYPGMKIDVVDLLRDMYPKCGSLVYKGFELVVGKCPKIFNAVTELDRGSGRLVQMLLLYAGLERMTDVYRPDVVIATCPVISAALGEYKQRFGKSFRLVTYITDIFLHPEWISKYADAYAVGDEMVRQALIAKGIDADRIFVCGLPVRKAFRAASDSTENQRKEILIMGGGLGLIKNIENFLTNFKFHREIHVTIVTGKNIRLFERLSRFAEDMPNVEICGYIEDIERYYERADLIVTKPGGITMFEAIYTGTPMLVTSPALIQEKANARFISEKHIGRVVSDENSTGAAALQMLGDDREREYIKASMKRIKQDIRPHGMKDILDRCEAGA